MPLPTDDSDLPRGLMRPASEHDHPASGIEPLPAAGIMSFEIPTDHLAAKVAFSVAAILGLQTGKQYCIADAIGKLLWQPQLVAECRGLCVDQAFDFRSSPSHKPTPVDRVRHLNVQIVLSS